MLLTAGQSNTHKHIGKHRLNIIAHLSHFVNNRFTLFLEPTNTVHMHKLGPQAGRKTSSLTLNRVIEGGTGSDQYVCAINSW